MTRLNQLLAVAKTAKAASEATITSNYQLLQKPAPLSGILRTYRPLQEDGVQLPSESTRVQVRVEDAIKTVNDALVRLFDITATIDATNCVAKADIVVDGETLAANVPATTLLFIEKKLVDITTFVRKLPCLDPAETWNLSATSLTWQSDPVRTIRSEKVPAAHVLYPATDKHPAQVKDYTRDVPAGEWTTIRMSGAVPAARVADIMTRIAKLTEAVKRAREEANMTTVIDVNIGASLMTYLLG